MSPDGLAPCDSCSLCPLSLAGVWQWGRLFSPHRVWDPSRWLSCVDSVPSDEWGVAPLSSYLLQALLSNTRRSKSVLFAYFSFSLSLNIFQTLTWYIKVVYKKIFYIPLYTWYIKYHMRGGGGNNSRTQMQSGGIPRPDLQPLAHLPTSITAILKVKGIPKGRAMMFPGSLHNHISHVRGRQSRVQIPCMGDTSRANRATRPGTAHQHQAGHATATKHGNKGGISQPLGSLKEDTTGNGTFDYPRRC